MMTIIVKTANGEEAVGKIGEGEEAVEAFIQDTMDELGIDAATAIIEIITLASFKKSGSTYAEAEFTPHQRDVLAALADGESVSTACQLAKVSEGTYLGWLKDGRRPAFRKAKEKIFQAQGRRGSVQMEQERKSRRLGLT